MRAALSTRNEKVSLQFREEWERDRDCLEGTGGRAPGTRAKNLLEFPALMATREEQAKRIGQVGDRLPRAWPLRVVIECGATRNVDAAVLSDRHRKPDRASSHGGDSILNTRVFGVDQEAGIAETGRASGARLLLVATSSPMKERFLARYLERMGPVLAVGVGGSFDVWAGKTSRAPEWMQRSGLEWFHRFIQEPRRMWRRYLVGNLRFGWIVLRSRLQPRA